MKTNTTKKSTKSKTSKAKKPKIISGELYMFNTKTHKVLNLKDWTKFVHTVRLAQAHTLNSDWIWVVGV